MEVPSVMKSKAAILAEEMYEDSEEERMNEEEKEMTRLLVWDAKTINPILDMLNLKHFDDWVLHGNYTFSRPRLNEIKYLTEESGGAWLTASSRYTVRTSRAYCQRHFAPSKRHL